MVIGRGSGFASWRATWGVIALLYAVPHPASGQVVLGQVVDSIFGRPVSSIVVELVDLDGASVDSYLTDANGPFRLEPQSAGRYAIRVVSADSTVLTYPEFLTYDDAVTNFRVILGDWMGNAPVEAIRDLVEGVCPDQSAGRGVVAGFVVSSADSAPVTGASVVVRWPTTPVQLRELVDSDDVAVARFETDSTGTYVLCEVPFETPVRVHASISDFVSDFVTVMMTGDGVTDGDQFAPWHGINAWRRDLVVYPVADRHTVLKGIVWDTAGAPLSGVRVTVEGIVQSVETDPAGTFAMTNLPAGRVDLFARRIGLRPARFQVELRSNDTVEISPGTLVLGPIPVRLRDIVVDGGYRPSLAGFFERRATANGTYVTRQELDRRINRSTSAIISRAEPLGRRDRVPRLGRVTGRTCPRLYYRDGYYIGTSRTIDINVLIPPEWILAVEIYSPGMTIPWVFQRPFARCGGVVVIWTR